MDIRNEFQASKYIIIILNDQFRILNNTQISLGIQFVSNLCYVFLLESNIINSQHHLLIIPFDYFSYLIHWLIKKSIFTKLLYNSKFFKFHHHAPILLIYWVLPIYLKQIETKLFDFHLLQKCISFSKLQCDDSTIYNDTFYRLILNNNYLDRILSDIYHLQIN